MGGPSAGRVGGVLLVVLASSFVATAVADAPLFTPAPPAPAYITYSGYFDAKCPEGCRDVDKYVSCGGVDSSLLCNMTVDGNVTMACDDGMIYWNAAGVGCGSFFDDGTWQEMIDGRWDARTVLKFVFIFGKFYESFDALGSSPPHIGISVIQIVVALYLLTLSVRFEKVTRILCGFIVGELLAMIALAAFGVTLNTYAKGVPMWVLPVAVGLVAAVWRRVIAFLCGFGVGFMVGVIACTEAYQRSGQRLDYKVFYTIMALTGFFTTIAQAMKRPTLMLFVGMFTALCGTAAFVQLAGQWVINLHCTDMSTAVTTCEKYGAEGVFATLFVVSIASQKFQQHLAEKQMLRRQAQSEAQPLNSSANASPGSSMVTNPGGGIYGAV